MSTQTLTLPQCKEYVKNIKDLEVSCYMQERLLAELKRKPTVVRQRIAELNQQLQTEKEPEKPSPTGNAVGSTIASPFFALVGAVIGAVIGLIVKIIIGLFSIIGGVFRRGAIDGFGWLIFSDDLGTGAWKPFLFWGAVIGFVITLIFCLFGTIISTKEAIGDKNSYPQSIESFRKKQLERQRLIEKKKQELETAIPHEIQVSEKMYQDTKALLKKYYDMDFIYPKYRSLVPICTIYEYLESGRCFSLLGHEGAYNLYEKELRMNTIIGKLDDIIERLDEINANQQLLAQEIRQCNSQLHRISNSLDNIENNTELTAYHSSITASNTTFMAWLSAFSYDEQRRTY